MMRDRQLLPNDESATDGVVMYETNFGFHRQPFQCADLARAFFVSESIRNVLPQLLHAMRSDLGIAVLTGPPGVGKTTFLKHLQFQLKHEGRAIMCSGASLETPTEVLQMLQSASQLRAGELSTDLPTTQHVPTRWTVIEQMRKTREFWGPVLLFVDDAQLLSVPVLNELRAFTEEEWNGRGLVRCLIAGPLSLEEELGRPAQADFSRRIRCHAFLQPLSSRESIELLNRHLDVVGGRLREVFSAQALELIATAADGMPRCLSLLADESLVVAAEHTKKIADETCVRKALGRLQHLAYAWNASPLLSEETAAETQHEQNFAASVKPAAAVRQAIPERISSVVEIGSPGVIEIGGTSCPSIGASLSTVARVAAAAVGNDSPAITSPAVEFGFVNGADQKFEVGHRYQPNALEAVDVVEMDAFENDPDFLTDAEQTLLVTNDGPDAGLNNSVSIPPVGAGRPSSRVYFLNADNHEHALPVATVELSNRRPQELTAGEHSSQVPVFDRYTWISLGRDVPAGTSTVSSALEMQRVSGSFPGNNQLGPNSMEKPAFRTAFDNVPVLEVSDSEILASLQNPTSVSEQGTFVTRQPVEASQQILSSAVDDQPRSPFQKEGRSEPPVGVELFNPTETVIDSAASDSRNFQAPATVSESDRQFIRNAILSTLSQYLPGTQAADANGLEGSAAASTDSALFGETASHPESHVPAEWHDGQLLFSDSDSDALTEAISQRVLNKLSEATPDGERFSLSFEAARAARDENVNHVPPERNTPDEESLPEKFFTLPVNPRTLEWDLRSGMLAGEDISPLADSLASLRDEVNSFQHTGRPETLDHELTVSRENVSPVNVSPVNEHPAESLVAIARRRLDQVGSEQEAGDSPLLKSATNAATARVSSSMASEVNPAAMNSGNAQKAGTGNSCSSGGAGVAFSQLFTRLRKIRTQTAENR